MAEKKTLRDLKGWKELFQMRSQEGNLYAVYVSPDERRMAQVHVDDDEVSLILNRGTNHIEYAHPKTLLGAERVLGHPVTMEELEKHLKVG